MGKHNGKSRSLGGTKVGAALTRRNKGSGAGGKFGDRHTTDMGAGNMQSVLDRSDLDELMAMADLADRDFTAERYQSVVISTGGVDPFSSKHSAAERAAAEQRNQHRLCIPRRPAWDASTTTEQLEAQEKSSFLDWRRSLAFLEEEEGLLLTPFERNLEVWRQLWRVLERSDIVVQVVDARDPLTYWSSDLVNYTHDLHPTKTSLVLLNKADLLPAAVRTAWADYFDQRGVQYAFWSAAAASNLQKAAQQEANVTGVDPELLAATKHAAGMSAASRADPRIQVYSVDQLLDWMEEAAAAAVAASSPDDPRRADPSRRVMVGLVGYPNVGKSSTINAIFGSKKTAVAATPGKTKHFQTLNVSPTVCLCDCPGLVFPRFARSKSEMVAAGVIPIDRLTDVRAPVEVVAARCGASQLAAVYGLRFAPTAAAAAAGGGDAGSSSTPSSSSSSTAGPLGHVGAMRVLAALALSRGWVSGSGLPDEARAGRQILKDYTAGKLLYCQLPPGHDGGESFAPVGAPTAEELEGLTLQQQQQVSNGSGLGSSSSRDGGTHGAAAGSSEAVADAAGTSGATASVPPAVAAAGDRQNSTRASAGVEQAAAAESDASDEVESAGPGVSSSVQQAEDSVLLDMADLELLDGLGTAGAKPKQKRADHKFHKKAARSKGNRGQEVDAGGYDGAALLTGKKGGLVRVAGY